MTDPTISAWGFDEDDIAEINAQLDQIEHQLATCDTCRVARKRRQAHRAFSDEALAECCGTREPACATCTLIIDAHRQWALAEIYVMGAHPHGATT